MPKHTHSFHHQPPWWPANEPWPPQRGQFRRKPFFRRLGCLFGLFNLLGLAFLLFIIVFIAHFVGLIHLTPRVVALTLPLGVVAFVLIVIALVSVGVALRRIFNPLDNLLEAADRVTEGDYTVRVAEKGPGGVRSLTRAFNKMAARLHQTDEQRRNLLADVTHELRTPLTVIQGNLEGMLDGVYPADEANLRALLDETHLLSRLIDDLRTLALAESGALQLRKEPTDPMMLIRETAGAFQPQAEAAGVALTVTGAVLPLVSLDPSRMRQVLANLIANALRYAALGGTGGAPSSSAADNLMVCSRSKCATAAPASPPKICRTSSNASINPLIRVVWGWALPSPATSSWRMAAASVPKVLPAQALPSGWSCRLNNIHRTFLHVVIHHNG